MTIFRIAFIVLGLSAVGAGWYLGRQGIGGESSDIPSLTDKSVRVGSSGSYASGGRVK